MDIDDLLADIVVRWRSSRDPHALRRLVEHAVQARLGVASAAIRAVSEAPPGRPAPVEAVPDVLTPIPGPLQPGAFELAVHPQPGRILTVDERRFLRRAAAVYAIAAAAARDRVAGGDDERVRDGAAPLIGQSPVMQDLRARIGRVAATDFTVLIEGESGSGKELVARQIHELSQRRRGPFVAVNCAAIVETLLEAELFGIEDRTATGVRGRRGKFEQATCGTLFLDEVADLSPTAQAKLLRALQDFTVERVGGQDCRRMNIRLVVATNRRLHDLVAHGVFREDLYYRLSGVELLVPPLRTRREDIGELARYFLARHRAVKPLELSLAAADALAAYDWPGNVRELERLIESAVVLAAGERIELADLPPAFQGRYLEVLQPSAQAHESLREWSRRYIRLVLHQSRDNKREACRILGISYHTLQAHLRYPSRRPALRRERGAPGLRAAPASAVHEHATFGTDDSRGLPD